MDKLPFLTASRPNCRRSPVEIATFYLAEPVVLPAGTEIIAVATFDNSRNNPHNPDPLKEVYWGQQSWEEMLVGFIDIAVPVTTDPSSIGRATR